MMVASNKGLMGASTKREQEKSIPVQKKKAATGKGRMVASKTREQEKTIPVTRKKAATVKGRIVASTTRKLGKTIPVQKKKAATVKGKMAASNKGMMAASNKGMMVASNKGLMGASTTRKQEKIIPVQKKKVVTVKERMVASNKGIKGTANKGMMVAYMKWKQEESIPVKQNKGKATGDPKPGGSKDADGGTSEFKNALLNRLQCPVCYSSLKSPIYMCLNGHNVCNVCKTKVTECPICRVRGGPEFRNIAVEGISQIVFDPANFKSLDGQMVFGCIYSGGGCKHQLNIIDMQEHVKFCEFRYKCYMCDWVGDSDTLLQHVTTFHPMHYDCNNQPIDFEKNFFHTPSNIFYLHVDGVNMFWIHIDYQIYSAALFLRAHYIGYADDAAKYQCKFSLNSESNDYRFSYRGPISPLDVSTNFIRVEKFVLDQLMKSSNKFTISFKIYDR